MKLSIFNMSEPRNEKRNVIAVCILFLLAGFASAQQLVIPDILSDKKVMEKYILPDFSYAGYQFGEKEIPSTFDHTLNILDFGAIANDGKDDTPAFKKALQKADDLLGYVLIEIPSGKYNIADIIYINRSKTVLKGEGSGLGGTTLFFERPLRFVDDPPQHVELKEYLIRFDKRVVRPDLGIDTPFSQYSWSGAFLWVAKKGKLYKSYNIPEYNQPVNAFADALSGKQGEFEIVVKDPSKLAVGEIYKLCWYNKEGENGSILKHVYDNQDVTIGEHHWNNPDNPLISQMVMVTDIKKNTVKIKTPLLHDVKPEWFCAFTEWEHIEEVGIENMAFEFPISTDFPHHCEDGYNAIYLTSLMNGWVRNVGIKNADSGILTDDISNVTIENIKTYGEKLAHYSVATGEVHNVLIRKLRVENTVTHPLSFNTRSTRCVYTDCMLEKSPLFDQHSGLNEQNLFDNIKVFVDAPIPKSLEFRLLSLGGSSRWAPGHGAFNTFYNIDISFANVPEDISKPIVLHARRGLEGVSARFIGVHANHPVSIKYGPNAYFENTNSNLSIGSLYEYQLSKRLK